MNPVLAAGVKLPLYVVDAFTDRPFAGNPAAVCLLPAPADGAWMQRLAQEMNLSETAFPVVPPGDGPHTEFDLRWFTPGAEVDLAGHPTLATAHVLWETGRAPTGEALTFHTASGELVARRGQGGWIEMDFPAEPPEPWHERSVEEVAAALRLDPAEIRAVAANRLDLLVELPTAAAVLAVEPAMEAVARLPVRGVIVTAAGRGEAVREGAPVADFVSRFFAPQLAVPEDPVTGSAHCGLTPWWAERLGRRSLLGYQASRRGGVVRVRHEGERVCLAGQAVTVSEGHLHPVAAPSRDGS